MSYSSDAADSDQTDYSALGQELLKQNMQQGYIPNSGIGGILAQMFGSYMNASMANPSSPWAMSNSMTVNTGNPGASLGMMQPPGT